MKMKMPIHLVFFFFAVFQLELAAAQTEKMSAINAAWAHNLVVVVLLLLLVILFFWYQKQRDRQVQLTNLMEKDKAEKQLETLKSQINPHFLFNSLNTLIAVIETDPKLAVEYVENLSDFYRKIMQLRNKELIPLQEEEDLIKNYAYLLERRYGSNFRIDIAIGGLDGFIVPLTLQILVENAIKHNVISRGKPLTIRICQTDDDHIVVVNSLQPKVAHEESTRFGLQSLVLRYDLLGKRKVKVEKTEGEFKVSIPIIK